MSERFGTHGGSAQSVMEALRESEERFRGAFDHAAIGMAIETLEAQYVRVNPALCRLFGYTERESRPLIDFFNEFASDYQFTYRHKWSLGDVLMWDNRCLLHYAVQDYDTTQLRVLQRCTLFAPVSGAYYDPDEADGIRKTPWSRKTDAPAGAAQPAVAAAM